MADATQVPPPPNGGTPVPNPHYVAPTMSSTDDSIPAFIRNAVDVNRIQQVVQPQSQVQGDGPKSNVVAEVDSTSPNRIDVFQPNRYDAGSRNHELTHIYQDSRSNELPQSQDVKNNIQADNDPYDYSGSKTSARTLPQAQQMQVKLEGLQKAQKSGKTITDYNTEQQAEMVRDYKQQHDSFLQKVKDGKATKTDLQKMSDLQNTYHPFIEQMANMPSKDAAIHPGYLNLLLGRHMPTIDTRPAAPGLPSFATAGMGMVTADPLMGGKSQAIAHVKNALSAKH